MGGLRSVALNLLARLRRRYYVEDYVRVYPGGKRYDRRGRLKEPSRHDRNNFLNHMKFYEFAAQFVAGKVVLDAGCGSGYGTKILAYGGAGEIHGVDLSEHAIDFARRNFGEFSEFSVQPVTQMAEFADHTFDVCICSEVLEHLKDYGKEKDAIVEISRVCKVDGLIILGTPNIELSNDHGFSYQEISGLCEDSFRDYVLFENSLLPDEKAERLWHERKKRGLCGVVVNQDVKMDEVVLDEAQVRPRLKRAECAAVPSVGDHLIDTTKLHNTHSWAVVALNAK